MPFVPRPFSCASKMASNGSLALDVVVRWGEVFAVFDDPLWVCSCEGGGDAVEAGLPQKSITGCCDEATGFGGPKVASLNGSNVPGAVDAGAAAPPAGFGSSHSSSNVLALGCEPRAGANFGESKMDIIGGIVAGAAGAVAEGRVALGDGAAAGTAIVTGCGSALEC